MMKTADNIKESINSGRESKSILHIPTEKKKPSKNDTPLEKEMRKFNKLVKELEEQEKNQAQQRADDEEYHQLYMTKVYPVLFEVAETQLLFIAKIEAVFYSGKFSKNLEKRFVDFVLPILQDASAYLDEAKEKLANYYNWKETLYPKADKAPVVAEENEDDDLEEDFRNTGFTDEEYFTNEYKNNNNEKIDDIETKSISDLYKELAKQIHPDLEQDENKKYAKEQLMKELIAAKDKEDVHAMLLIRQKADALNDHKSSEKSYSLQVLQLYNKSLKKKLDAIKRDIARRIFQSFSTSANFLAQGKKQHTAEMRIKNEIKNLKELQDNLQHNTRIISSSAQLKELLDL